MLTFEKWVLCGNPLQQSHSGSEPDPEPNREFGPLATTMHAWYCLWPLPSGRRYNCRSFVEIPLNRPLASWKSWLCGFVIVPHDCSRPVTTCRSMFSRRLLGDGVVGHAMQLSPPPGRYFNQNLASLHHSTAKFAWWMCQSDIHWGIEEYQPRSHLLLGLSQCVVRSLRSRS